MSRAFATLEGIGLSSDPNYAILQECFPYLAKRLLSDDSPRARGALRTLLYGQGDELNLDQLKKVTQGLESYTSSTASVAASTGESDAGRAAALEQYLPCISLYLPVSPYVSPYISQARRSARADRGGAARGG